MRVINQVHHPFNSDLDTDISLNNHFDCNLKNNIYTDFDCEFDEDLYC